MLFQRFWCAPLAQAAYLIGDGGEAVIVDPLRDADELLAGAARAGLRVRHVIGTHVHADFVAGLAEVAAATGAEIAMGERFAGKLPCRRLPDGAEIEFGGARLKVLETPGHTEDSVCLLVVPPDGDGAPERLLSGDTLFLGDVGRPDLAAGAGRSARDMARRLHASVHGKIAPLPDATEVWPAHGAGSACGVNIACEASSTIGLQRLANWALGEPDVERFCDRLLGALRPPPRYFARVAALNQSGPRLIAELAPPRRLSVDEVARAQAAGATVLDVRTCIAYGRGHWPGALGVGLDGGEFEAWAGALLPDGGVVVHAENAEQAHSAWLRLLRIGAEDVVGWTDELPPSPSKVPQIEAVDLFLELQKDPRAQVLDVRRASEYATGHVPGTVNTELGPELSADPALAHFDRARPTAVLCEGGYRSNAALQQLQAMGFTALRNVVDGMTGWRANALPVERAG
ncbi:MAG TPA: rhodanese-like domain-containing protein [Planctomycetota bacterium]|nr:rhodanese-like domain-containing protein [Planctomycetota bacterium]